MHAYGAGMTADEIRVEFGVERVVRLSTNENPLGPSPKAVEALKLAVASSNLYPDGAARDLKAALSAKFGVPQAQIVIGNGSDELIRMLGTVLLDCPEDEVVVGDPSFIVYDSVAQLVPCRLVKVPLNSKFEHDLPAMARQATERTRIVFLANPSNPTGTVVRKPDVDGFLRDVPDTTLVVLDEAYFEFAAHLEDFPNSLDYLSQGKSVAGLRTFSKAYGLAGLRCGYGFFTPEVADALERSREPFNVNLLAQAACVAALGDEEHVRRTLENNAAGMKRIAGALRRVGATVSESFANFVWANLGRPAGPLCRALLEQGVVVRSGDIFECANCVRVSVGSVEEVSFFENALERAVSAIAS